MKRLTICLLGLLPGLVLTVQYATGIILTPVGQLGEAAD